MFPALTAPQIIALSAPGVKNWRFETFSVAEIDPLMTGNWLANVSTGGSVSVFSKS